MQRRATECHKCLDPETDIGTVRMLPLKSMQDHEKYAHSKHNSYWQKQENQGFIRNHVLKLKDVM